MIRTFLLSILIFNISFSATWVKIEGQYSSVEYTKGNSVIADSLLKIAELDIPRLCKMSGLPLKSYTENKARIILTDAPDISNGYAIGDAIVIYALSSMYLPMWTGNDSWYKMVLSHELVHQTVFRKSGRRLSFLGLLVDMSVPRWFHEGISQYFAERWTAFRGDIYLQEAVLGGRLTFENMESMADGALLYSAGHAYVRWLADTYGDTCIVKLLFHNEKGMLYDFNDAFKSVYHKKPSELFPEFIRHMVIHYGSRLVSYPVSDVFKTLPETGFTNYQLLPLSQKDSTYLALIRKSKYRRYASAVILQFRKGKAALQKTITDHIHTPLILSRDKQYAAWGRHNFSRRDDQIGLGLRWYTYHFETGREELVTKNIRARFGVFDEDNNLVLSEVSAAGTAFRRFNGKDVGNELLLETKMPAGNLNLMPDGRILFDAQQAGGRRAIFILDKGKLTALTNDSLDNRMPLAVNDSLIVFNRIEGTNAAIAVYNLNSRSYKTHINDQYAYWLAGYDDENRDLVCMRWKAGRENEFRYLALDSLLKADIKPRKTPAGSEEYSSWMKKTPRPVNLFNLPDTALNITQRTPVRLPQFPMHNLLSFAMPAYDEKQGFGIYGMTLWLETLQRQMLQAAFFIFPKDYTKSYVLFSHLFNAYNNQFLTTYYHGPAVFSYQSNEYIDNWQDILRFEILRSFFIFGSSRTSFTPGAAYVYNQYMLTEKQQQYPAKFSIHGMNISFSLQHRQPTALYPVVPSQYFNLFGFYYQSFDDDYDFNIKSLSLNLGSNLFLEKLGITVKTSYKQAGGRMPPLKRLGIDRFYQFDVPRDILETETVRGVRQDISGSRMFWASLNAGWFLAPRTNLKLLFLPVNNLAFTVFYDYAWIRQNKFSEVDVSGYGAEIGFGEQFFRLSAGYAVGQGLMDKESKQLYTRVSLILP